MSEKKMSSEELMRRSLLALALEVPQSVHQSVSDNVHAYVNELLEEVAQRGLRLAEIAQIIEDTREVHTYTAVNCERDRERIYRLAKGEV